jgi:hypothetical protein
LDTQPVDATDPCQALLGLRVYFDQSRRLLTIGNGSNDSTEWGKSTMVMKLL